MVGEELHFAGLRFGRRRSNFFYIFAFAVLILFLFGAPIPAKIQTIGRNQITQAIKSRIFYKTNALNTTVVKHAYATFLLQDEDSDEQDLSQDKHLTAARMLVYQLLYAKETKSALGLPIIVLVTKDVSEEKRRRLRRDGAIVHEVAEIGPDVAHSRTGSSRSILAKLHLWEMVQFERILFLESGTVLNGKIELVFLESGAITQKTGRDQTMIEADDPPLPKEYGFASIAELTADHSTPPADNDWVDTASFDTGLMILKPSLEMSKYYLSLLNTTDRFDLHMPEQNLLNYAHRWGGNVPWQAIEPGWSARNPTMADVEDGVRALHTQWWKPYHKETEPYLLAIKDKMENYFDARDDILKQAEIYD